MKNKFAMFVAALLSLSVIGLVQLSGQAEEAGKVDGAPRCNVEPVGKAGNVNADLTTESRPNLAFSVTNSIAKVSFKVKGSKDCKVRVTINSFHAPALDGKPWDKQVIYQPSVKTKVFTKGTYTMSTPVPTEKKKGMCHYQVDLTYGTGNVLPIIAYGHGTIQGCLPPPATPAAACSSLTPHKLNEDSTYRFDAAATTSGGATVNSYTYVISKDGAAIKNSGAINAANYTYKFADPGTYTVQVFVNTSAGNNLTGPACTTTITIPPKEEPGIQIQKLVEGVEYKRVNVDVEYSYRIAVTNTGNKDLTKAVVTDTPAQGITLVSSAQGTITNNKWTHTIPSLKIGETMNFTIKAKVPEYLAGRITNTVCVDTPDVPGAPDDCDTADVDVPEDEKVVVCNPETGETITVDKKDQDKYVPIDSPKCKKETPPTPENPKADVLPTTGPEEVIAQLFGAASLASAGAYYITSRRQ